MSFFTVPTPADPLQAVVPMVSSKSESNRALILRSLAGDGIELKNLSAARDTRLLEKLLASDEDVLDARDAGTTLRFLTARCVAAGRPALITGTPRMQQRPIGILVDALRELGGAVDYEGETGFPPLRIHPSIPDRREVSIPGDVSSQYASALLLIAPFLPQGLSLTLTGKIASRPYIDMTVAWMRRFGLTVRQEGNHFDVQPQEVKPGSYTIESDWSGAGYWYSLMALRGSGTLELMHLREDSLQGDRRLAELFTGLGVETQYASDCVIIRPGSRAGDFEADFSDIPDQAQTFAVCCAALGIPARLHGVESLRIKETDRIAALQTELARFGCEVKAEGDHSLILPGTSIEVSGQTVNTYEDHRMAMAFAPLAALGTIQIDDPEVVCKSYPNFWDDWSLTC